MGSRGERTTETGQDSTDEGASGLSLDESRAIPSQSTAPQDRATANDNNGVDVGPVHAEDEHGADPVSEGVGPT